jgi:DNA polymerase III subunit delta'
VAAVSDAVTAVERPEVWSGVVGQDDAVAQLEAAALDPVHAYLIVGPPGSGKRALARGFAALLLSADAPPGSEAVDRHVHLALAEQHPDLRVVEPEGNTFRRVEAEELVRHASLAPVEGARKVVVGIGCEAMEDQAAGGLLKTIEEPSASTVFVLLTTEVAPELVTIASRCVRVELRPLTPAAIAQRLVAEGLAPDEAATAAEAAGGDLDRARTLATDARLSLRHAAWRDLPHRLDGTGHRAAEAVAELAGMIDEALGPLQQRQAAAMEELAEQIERYGLRAGAKKDLETQHRREARRFRTAELRFGLATLANAYRSALAATDGPGRNLDEVVAALDRIDAAALALQRYPNETLLLQALVANLPGLPARNR